MKMIVEDSKLKPVPVLGGFRCPKCKKMLKVERRTIFGFDLICPKGDFIAGVCEG